MAKKVQGRTTKSTGRVHAGDVPRGRLFTATGRLSTRKSFGRNENAKRLNLAGQPVYFLGSPDANAKRRAIRHLNSK